MTGNNLLLSIYPGVDLLGLSFKEAGYTIVWGPDVIWGWDIKDFHPPAGVFEGIIGGPPCPDFSPLRYLIAAHGYKSRHGNLIPEFERVVSEAQPDWFLMEEGPLAPDANIPGYAPFGFFLCPTYLGEAQSRKRKICFGVRGDKPVDLRQWIDYAVFGPMIAENTVVGGHDETSWQEEKVKTQAVTKESRAVPVLIGDSGKVKATAVTSHDQDEATQRALYPSKTVYEDGKVKKRARRSWEESCRLQGLPGDFLKDAPFTLAGKREVLGNGVQMDVGRALARAIRKYGLKE